MSSKTLTGNITETISAPGSGTRYHHGDLRAALLEAGDAVLAAEGFRGFTLRACARHAGVSHAAPKHHFDDVTGFLTAIAARGFDRLTTRLETTIGRAADLAEEFEATSRAYLGFAEDYPEHFRIMFRSDLLSPDDENLRAAASQTFVVLTNVILRQRGEAEITELDETLQFAGVIKDIGIGWCHIHGLAHLVLEQQLAMFSAEERDALIVSAAERLSALLQARIDS
jgi:AcrR family transcriptional regulator